MCELATQSASFANQSQDFLVDMFNDEIESVRLNAINSIRKIAHHISLREDQLEIITAVLKVDFIALHYYIQETEFPFAYGRYMYTM